MVARPLVPGIYAPLPTFFKPDTEDVDLQLMAAHAVRLIKAGVKPLLSGTMGEAHHLSHEERVDVIKAVRVALDDAGFAEVPIIAGSGAGSTRETIQLSKEAADAGADYVIVICSGYFAGALVSNRKALKAFWSEVSAKSPIPVIIYNYPGAAGGIDLDSDLITELAEECPNLCGVKLTCGNVGKLTRICATVSEPAFASAHPRQNADAPFIVLGGFTDFILTSSMVNGHGAITGLANIAPATVAKLFDISEKAKSDLSLLPEAQRLQGIVARADFTIAKTGIAGTKYLLEKLYGYGGNCRRPLPPIEPAAATAIWEHPHTQELVKLEREFAGKT
ncbi:dihydrodipicolinate synthetase [Epithele typhae]|uniref:dihydrodipicolinate synthetase n=1 Tax=Epithele typhae TaxID=378194 RepID=UPI0020088D70|nr:dihydrodipicolinate synthetase [Epithele typhae]KAH9946123.1 dihydrodipicolinate synthetase [Epithele typhae]